MKFKIIEDYLDKEKKFYDFKTEDVKGEDVFDMHKTGMSFYDQLIPGHPENDYMKQYKGLVGEIVEMTPEEYYKACSELFKDYSVQDLKNQRGYDKAYLEHLREVILKYHKKFPMTMIDLSGGGQEGLHRMFVVGELFGWDKKCPVLVVKEA